MPFALAVKGGECLRKSKVDGGEREGGGGW